MFAACAVLALTTSRRNSITVDEFGNLPRGLHIWHDRDYSLDAETTPLASMLAALPVTLSESVDLTYRSNLPVTPWTIGEQFMRNNAARYQHIYDLARIASILALLATCAGVWGLARALYGRAGAFLALVVAIVVLNLAYMSLPFASVPFGDLTFATPTMRRLMSVVPNWLPSPFPMEFLRGLDAQFSEAPYDAYLLGTFNTTGFWNYYLVGVLVKTPEPILLLALAALTFWQRLSPREIPLLVVAVGAFVVTSLVGHKNIGMRYVLFVAPLVAIWIGRIATAPLWHTRPRLVRRGVAVLCAWLIAVTLSSWPHYLAYFNAASGGADNGHAYLLDSNLDWGQDLITLRDYMAREHIDAIDLAYFGRVDPKAIYGINYTPFWDTIGHRHVVISANFLWGRGYGIYGTGRALAERDQFRTFLSVTPAAILGHSLYVYDLAAR